MPWADYTSDVKKLIIEDGVTSISEHTAYGCFYATSISIGKDVKSIGPIRYTFYCRDLETITVSEDNEYYKSVDNVLFSKDGKELLKVACKAFSGTYNVPDGVVRINEQAFDICKNIEKVVLPDSVEEIGEYAFYQCKSLKILDIGMAKISSVGNGVFEWIEHPVEVIVDKDNEYVSVVNGSLFSKIDGTLFYAYVTDNKCVVPYGVKIIPESTIFVEDGSVVVPDTVETIEHHGINAFDSVVHYLGTESQFQEIYEGDMSEFEWFDIPLHYCVQQSNIPASCTDDGVTEWYCSTCDETIKYVTGYAFGHDIVEVEAQTPTCTEIGWDAYEYCTACDYTTYVELPVSGHTASPTYAPTADGSQHVATYSCCGCNETVPEKHVFGSDNICICGAKIEFTGVEVSNQYDLIDKGNGNYIAAVAPGALGTDITFKYVGKNLEYLTADNTLLKTHCDNSTLGECEDPLEVMIETDFTGKVMNWKDGAWWEWEYSNDGGITWEGVHVDVKQGYTITNATTDTNGSVVVPEYHVADETVVLTVTPADGYILATLTVTDAEGNLVTVENNSFTMPASAVTVNATFVVCDHTGGEATCSVQAVCENCGTNYFDANKHTLVQVDAKAPTCTEIGWEAYEYCTACTYTTYVEKETLKHSFTKYEETEAPKCGVAGKEVAYCDNGCGEIEVRATEALKHSFTKYEVTEEAKCGVAGKKVAACDNGCGETDEKAIEALKHLFIDYIYNEDATCTADGTKTAECIYGCGETDTVTAEDTMLNHADEDGDKICDDCETEIKDVCPDCGGPAHEETGVPQYICMLITLIKLVVSLVKVLQSLQTIA